MTRLDERPHEDLILRRCVCPRNVAHGTPALPGDERAADDIGVCRLAAVDSERRVDPGRRVVVHLVSGRQLLKRGG